MFQAMRRAETGLDYGSVALNLDACKAKWDLVMSSFNGYFMNPYRCPKLCGREWKFPLQAQHKIKPDKMGH